MIAKLFADYQALSTAARARLAGIKAKEAALGNQEASIAKMKRQLKDREAELLMEVSLDKAEKKLTEAAIKNTAALKCKDDPAYQQTQRLLDEAAVEQHALEAELYELLREHALDKRQLEAIAGLSAAYRGTADSLTERVPIAASAPASPKTSVIPF